MKMKRNFEKGITLIALVVTIIVLIILAAVSINLLLGQNGIIRRAQQAKEEHTNAQLEEQETLNELEKQIADYEKQTSYLVDVAEIGDYVDIEIPYTNQQTFTSGYTTTTSALEGWRVISKSGSGETGTVTLVSASCPLTYYFKYMDAIYSDIYLSDMYTTLNTSSSYSYFASNGFGDSWDMTTYFTTTKYIDTSKGIHALFNEISTAYRDITGMTKTITELSVTSSYMLKTENIETAAGSNWKDSYTDLLGIGETYWLGNSRSAGYLWYVNDDGQVNYKYGSTFGIRVVVSLQSGVRISSTNTGTGASSSSAYSITK